jgi:hypothetical protein
MVLAGNNSHVKCLLLLFDFKQHLNLLTKFCLHNTTVSFTSCVCMHTTTQLLSRFLLCLIVKSFSRVVVCIQRASLCGQLSSTIDTNRQCFLLRVFMPAFTHSFMLGLLYKHGLYHVNFLSLYLLVQEQPM